MRRALRSRSTRQEGVPWANREHGRELACSLHMVLCRVGQGAFVLEDLAQIAAINPAAARLASDEVLGFVLRRVADELAMYLPRGDAGHLPQSSSASRLTAGASGFLNFSQSGDRPVASLFETIPPAPSCRYDENYIAGWVFQEFVEAHASPVLPCAPRSAPASSPCRSAPAGRRRRGILAPRSGDGAARGRRPRPSHQNRTIPSRLD